MRKPPAIIAFTMALLMLTPALAEASDKNRLRLSGPSSKYKSLPILNRDSTAPLVEPVPDAPSETPSEKNARIMTGLRDQAV